MGTKILNLVSKWPPGGVLTTKYLTSHGYSSQLLQRYKATGWISPIGDGAYLRVGDKPTVYGAISALNKQLKIPIHFGGRIALKLQGTSHHLNLGKEAYDLFHPNEVKVPKWFSSYSWQGRITTHKQSLFGDDLQLGVKTILLEGHPCLVSSKERALLEFINMTTNHERFLEAMEFVASSTILDPALLQKLLESCRSFKAKRVFLYAAEKAGWDWFKKLKLGRVSLGIGARTVIANGEFDSKYKITVPKEWLKGALV